MLDRDPITRQAGDLYRRLWRLWYLAEISDDANRTARLRRALLKACRRYGRRAGTALRAI